MLNKYLSILESWLGYNEADGTDDIIINIYNSQRPAGSYKMALTDPWCHATISAAAYKCGISDTIIPNTCYCPDGINWFKARGRWVGRTSSKYNPGKGHIIYYDWQGDGESDHVGCITKVTGNQLKVLEGNKSDRCEYRYIDKYNSTIQGYGVPDWDGKGGNIGTAQTPEERGWLQLGDTGASVKAMQEKLKAIGYNISADGEFGEETLAVVKQFQADNGLSVDGGFGEISSARLNALYNNITNNTNVSNTDYIGKYVKEFESGTAGPTSIEHCGDDGGLSYGTYQFIWSYGGEPGSAQNFWNKYYAAKYGKATSYTDLKTKWLKAVTDDRNTFIDNEWEYVLNGGEYYSLMLKYLNGFFNPDTYSRAMQDCCWSWAVHRGAYGASQEFKKACSAAGISNPQTADETKLINACYTYRWNNILFNGKKLNRYSPNGGEDSEYVLILTKVGLKPIDYITPSGRLIKTFTNNSTSNNNTTSATEDTAMLDKWQKSWLKSVQKIIGVKATGTYSDDMLNYMPIIDEGYTGELVTLVQKKLVHLQYTDMKPNGVYDKDTKGLIKEYQEWHSLTRNGVLNIATWKDLLSKRKGIK